MATTYLKLPKKFKEKWLNALRGGEYPQGKDNLLDDEGNYCCLGVGCDVLKLDKTEMEFGGLPEGSSLSGLPKYFDYEVGNSSLWQDKLTVMNDTGKSFDTIANWIEGNL